MAHDNFAADSFQTVSSVGYQAMSSRHSFPRRDAAEAEHLSIAKRDNNSAAGVHQLGSDYLTPPLGVPPKMGLLLLLHPPVAKLRADEVVGIDQDVVIGLNEPMVLVADLKDGQIAAGVDKNEIVSPHARHRSQVV